jgi:serine/threonine protein kinase
VKALAGLVPLGEVLYDVAAEALADMRLKQVEDRLPAALQELVQAPAEQVRAEAQAVVAEVAGTQPEAVRKQLSIYLEMIPAAVRRSLRRPADPGGASVPPGLVLKQPIDLLPFLPARLARFRPGDRPAGIGDWELTELLGVGGFGEVWKARHRFFDGIAPVALKFCLDESARDRLLQHEAAVLNQVMRQGRHPGIVPLLDASLTTNPPCLRYELIEGGDLAGLVRDWQQTGERVPWDRATRVLLGLARIVGFAHRLQPPIVHRDLKPANVLVQRGADGEVVLRVTDFGIGGVAAQQALRDAARGSTTHGEQLATSLRGSHTPLYASPQQVRGEAPDVRDDVHALGVIWYQLLSADLGSGPPTGLWADELEEAGVPRGLVRLLGACVASRPDKRPADAAVLAQQLEDLLRPAPAPAPPRPAPPPDALQGLLRALEANPFAFILDWTNKHIGDEGIARLAASPQLGRVEILVLSGNQVRDAGAKALAESPYLAQLGKLVLWDNQIGDEGVQALAASPYLANLTTLDLGSNRVGDAGVAALAASPHVSNLTALILVSNRIGDEGALALAGSPHLDNLAELKLLGNRITATGVTAVKNRFGKRVRIY